jgi:hypothetical protein
MFSGSMPEPGISSFSAPMPILLSISFSVSVHTRTGLFPVLLTLFTLVFLHFAPPKRGGRNNHMFKVSFCKDKFFN